MPVVNANAPLFSVSQHSVQLNSATEMPKAAGFLWNRQMMLHMNCRGYATAQFMQPEPAKYSHGPMLEAKTFMQPEHSYFAHHPGRFFYIKNEDTNELFSVPYEPVRCRSQSFRFVQASAAIAWQVECFGLSVSVEVNLSASDPLEMWQFEVRNTRNSAVNISIYPYFSIGYMSWMNQSASFDSAINGIVATSVTPYQKVEDYPKQKGFKDLTFLIAEDKPDSWTANQIGFEGEGGLANPDGINTQLLASKVSAYEPPVAVMQYRHRLLPDEIKRHRFVFGPATNKTEVKQILQRYFGEPKAFSTQQQRYTDYIESGKGCLNINSGDPLFDPFFNQWLPRQMFYHGDVNRLSTDPQTRNFLQDNMGMSYINPTTARQSFLLAVSQQLFSGAMPDGVLLSEIAELKYINQIPHTDHCVWLPICVIAYLNETGDISLLDEQVKFADSEQTLSVHRHIELALGWLIQRRDNRGLSYIEQGDWCDPMNMVGHKGRGVSSWLSLATAFALQQWAEINQRLNKDSQRLLATATEINAAVNQHCWDQDWFARGITDDNVVFGVKADAEGSIYLNPQSWALMSKAVDAEQTTKILAAVEKQLMTPYGPMMLAPAYTAMREDVGRLTQKYPGSAENGSVYNHAAVFYAYSLCLIDEHQKAFEILMKMLPSQQDAFIRGQLPTFIPNYYRGAFFQNPQQAGRSSQLFNTGTLAWYYRCIVEEIVGVKGELGCLVIEPHLPKEWPKVELRRMFNGIELHLKIEQAAVEQMSIKVNGEQIYGNRLQGLVENKSYQVEVLVPKTAAQQNAVMEAV
ncbi:GH36-type glycosyl hydrolase domain-containing protein [Shewanella kaireitica]|uniref:GH36-type glycosyl hydrolase domain-containing protein n=1 Tax=Shewanella kaireitica TaxID=212021 RepID=UPI0020104A0F|nr:NdvB protein [Shewanella kaireitica]MCL1092327.1 NdvB protein [Shewanella kaireitica]